MSISALQRQVTTIQCDHKHRFLALQLYGSALVILVKVSYAGSGGISVAVPLGLWRRT